jgi:type VI secretion system secreted protein VgrG
MSRIESAFLPQSGIKQVAAKGRFEVHAQSDGMDLLAKQGVQIISTEDRIEISSPKEM